MLNFLCYFEDTEGTQEESSQNAPPLSPPIARDYQSNGKLAEIVKITIEGYVPRPPTRRYLIFLEAPHSVKISLVFKARLEEQPLLGITISKKFQKSRVNFAAFLQF